MKNSLRIHKWTHNEFNIFILGVLTHPRTLRTVRNFFNWGCVLGRFAIYISTGRGAVCINARRTLHMSMD